jgi:hypothetical protein
VRATAYKRRRATAATQTTLASERTATRSLLRGVGGDADGFGSFGEALGIEALAATKDGLPQAGEPCKGRWLSSTATAEQKGDHPGGMEGPTRRSAVVAIAAVWSREKPGAAVASRRVAIDLEVRAPCRACVSRRRRAVSCRWRRTPWSARPGLRRSDGFAARAGPVAGGCAKAAEM